jgi:hypothetical protein
MFRNQFGLQIPGGFLVTILILSVQGSLAQNQTAVYSGKSYQIYPDKVVQNGFIATAVSSAEINSNYVSAASLHISPVIDFKFSINGKDNEQAPGIDHHFNCIADSNVTGLIRFGEKQADVKQVPPGSYLKPGTELKFRLDMRDIFAAFDKQGFYVFYNGDKLYKTDFKGVFVAGNRAPLIWDFNNLINHPGLELKDPDNDGIYETTVVLNKETDKKNTASSWKLRRVNQAFPEYHSTYVLSDALYNLSIEEMENAIEPDSTFRTGKEWSGVWTRDISYSILLSMAILQPKVAMNSLMRKVKNGKVVQDTGTGGAYPVSSDRMIWAVAAWEVYKVTGDRNWLASIYKIIRNSVVDDEQNVYDHTTGLVRGESSFLDWREETYPKWMQPADIYESECLGTNAVHFQVNNILSKIASLLGNEKDSKKFHGQAETIKKAMDRWLWMPEKGYYGQYLYGRNFKILSNRSESLGEALTVLFDIAHADKQVKIINETPVTDFGITCIYPQIPNILPYHNNAVWPFVASYWAMAAAKAGNEDAVMQAISSVYRPAALFLTNKENFVSSDGDYAGTQINSSNMLWSLSGNLALVYKVLFGMQYEQDSLRFVPFVPASLAGIRALKNFPYRNALLDIEMQGSGNQIQEITIDGKPLAHATLSGKITGHHNIFIRLKNKNLAGKKKISPFYVTVETPLVSYSKPEISWPAVEGAVNYQIIRNGKISGSTTGTKLPVDLEKYALYQVAAIDKNGISSFASEPVQIIPVKNLIKLEAEDFSTQTDSNYQGFSGRGFLDLTNTKNKKVVLTVSVTHSGFYALDCRYANGNGPINTENKCAIRTLEVNNKFAGIFVFPQRGKSEWSDWGMSNSVQAFLQEGQNKIQIDLKESNQNMNGEINQAEIDYVRLIRL